MQINKIINEKRDITTDTEEIQRFIRSYYKSLYSTKLKNVKDNFLDRYNIQKLNQDQMNNLNRPISPKEIEAIIESSQPKNAWGQLISVQNFIRASKKS